MPNPASGVFKQVAYKVESAYGAAPGQSGAQALRRVQSTLDLTKETYQSQEIRTSQQMADFRHGVRSVTGKIGGELSPGTWADFLRLALRRDFTAVTAIASLSVTIASTTSNRYTVTRSTGSWLTDGVKVGMVGRLSGGTLNVANSAKNLLVVALTATVATVLVLNGSAMVAEGPIASVTFTPTGKRTYTPTSGHTDNSMSVEHWYSDLGQSELFLGLKPTKIAIGLPATGLATVDVDMVGQDVADTTAKRGSVALTSQYFTSPTAANGAGLAAAVNGAVCIGGVPVATITGATLDIASNYTGDAVVGSNIKPFQFAGRVLVTGQITAYFDSVTLRDAFWAETEVEIVMAFSSDNTATSEFMAFTVSRVKTGGAAKDDGEKALVQTIPFQALERVSGGGAGTAYDQTTLAVQDSLAA